MANLWFPDSIVIKPTTVNRGGYCYYMDESDAVRGFVRCAEATAFSPFSAIDVERAEDDRYVHIRFRHTNKYWGRQGPGSNGRWIVATSDQPIDDTSKPTCTLFEPSMGNDRHLLLRHVQSDGQVALDTVQTGDMSARLYCYDEPFGDASFNFLLFDFVNLQTLLKLPKRVALKGDNDRFLRAPNQSTLDLSSTDPNERESAFEIELQDDGHIRIKSTNLNMYLRRGTNNWVLPDSALNTGNDTLFWPVHVRGSTYALRSAVNNNFCRRFTADNRTNSLSTSTSTITNTAQFLVQELVIERHIYHIRFRMDQVRIFDELPFIAGVGTSVNNTDEESSLTIKVSYEETRSYSFTNGEASTSGVSTTITTGIPKILSVGLEVSSEETKSFEWGETVEESTKAEASVTVTVPPKSRVRVDYVGTQGTCSVPFTYTQRDKSSSDGAIIANSNIDGLFEGVNYHSFHFEHYVVEPLPEEEIIA